MLRLDYEELGVSADKLTTEGERFQDCIDAMDKTINALPDIWEADTCDKYVERFNESKKTLNDVRVLIEDMAEQMRTISANFREADEKMAGQM